MVPFVSVILLHNYELRMYILYNEQIYECPLISDLTTFVKIIHV